jgi:polyferredoxin/NAD-dependent dihydropyrimidine dehydrogenase PreA subunit
MKRRALLWLKGSRIASQAAFLLLFAWAYARSLDPFSAFPNPFLRFDPLIFLTNPRLDLWLLAPILALLLVTMVLGRFFCGWVCPMGALIELSDFLLTPLRRANPLRLRGVSPRSLLVRFPPAIALFGASLLGAFVTPGLLPYFHPNVWAVRIFSLSTLGIVFLGLVVASSLFGRRLWCAYLCPLGALYGLLSRVSFLRLAIHGCAGCAACARCPMNAADHRGRTVLAHQCTLCFDFEHSCRAEVFSFGPARAQASSKPARTGRRGGASPDSSAEVKGTVARASAFDASRREFLILGAGIVGGAIVGAALGGLGFAGRLGAGRSGGAASGALTPLLRPPGVVDEARFLRRCIRCLHCAQSCPNGIIESTGLEAGAASLFTPRLNMEKNGCDFRCQVCQQVCPNQAIPLQSLSEKQTTPIGLAAIDQNRCVVFKDKKPCLVCEEVCPTPKKAVVFARQERIVQGSRTVTLRYPSVASALCIGCGICQANCPADRTAITVSRRPAGTA